MVLSPQADNTDQLLKGMEGLRDTVLKYKGRRNMIAATLYM